MEIFARVTAQENVDIFVLGFVNRQLKYAMF